MAGLVRTSWYGVFTLAAFELHFYLTERTITYNETLAQYWSKTSARIWEPLALLPVAVAVAHLVSRRPIRSVIVPFTFWLTVFAPFYVKMALRQAPLLPQEITMVLEQFPDLPLREQAVLLAWSVIGLATGVTLLAAVWRLHWKQRAGLAAPILVSALALVGLGALAAAEPGFPRYQANRWGHLVHYVGQAGRPLFARPPSRTAVAAAYAALQNPALPPKRWLPGRDFWTYPLADPQHPLYVILVESWIDPVDLGVPLSADPFPPRLRDWITRSKARLVVGTAKGGSSSTEFEVLAGIPSQLADSGWGIEFRSTMRQAVPGLPRKLRAAGVESAALEDSIIDHYDEATAYGYLGFERIVRGQAFDRADLDGSYLSDDSFFRQVVAMQASTRQPPRPFLHYLTTTASHFPYPLNEKVRPRFITSSPRSEDIEVLANRMAYTSRALLDLIDHLRQVDPQASLVAFGDHAPPPNDGMAATAYYKSPDTLYSAPLLWLDRLEKPLPLGHVPAYGLHYLILRHFGVSTPAWAQPFERMARLNFRNYPDVGMMAIGGDRPSTSYVYRAGNTPPEVTGFLAGAGDHLKVLARDVISGSQFVLRDSDAGGANRQAPD